MKLVLVSILLVLSGCLFPGKSGLVFKEKSLKKVERPVISEQEATPFDDLKATVLGPRCLKCHKDFATFEGIKSYVTPGAPDESELFNIVKDGRMPPKGKVLPSEELEFIRAYIEKLRPVVTFDDLKTRILVPHCLKCHKKMETEENLAAWIDPAAAENSKLYLRVHDGTMPKKAQPLGDEDQQFILDYLKSLKR